MLCCLGLFVGLAFGSTLSGPWTFIAPAIGFGLGFMGDTKLMRSSHGGQEGYGGGCCGSGYMHSKKVEKGARDPVCGMEVNEKTTKYKAEFEGKTYHFCSSTCRSMFKKDSGKYAK